MLVLFKVLVYTTRIRKNHSFPTSCEIYYSVNKGFLGHIYGLDFDSLKLTELQFYIFTCKVSAESTNLVGVRFGQLLQGTHLVGAVKIQHYVPDSYFTEKDFRS